MSSIYTDEWIRSEMEFAWQNFRTGKTDYRTGGPKTDEEALDYLPQYPPARSLYGLYREMGDSIGDAMIKVLKACTAAHEEPIR